MSDVKALAYSLIVIFLIGGLLPYLVSGFVEPGDYNDDSFIVYAINFVNNGFNFDYLSWTSWDNFSINVFDVLPDSAKEFIILQLSAFSFIPTLISLPLILILIVSMFYAFVKALPTT